MKIKYIKYLKQRGQALVLYALMVPVLLLAGGVGMDLGWYYLNVSRLQNAADAAVLAGAMKIVEQEDMSHYFVKVLTIPPVDIMEYNMTRDGSGEIVTIDNTLALGMEESRNYVKKNLEKPVVAGASQESENIHNDWNTDSSIGGGNVQMETSLYTKILDAKWHEDSTRYYQVTLTEQVSHLFLRNLEPMQARVTAYALLRPHDRDLVSSIKRLEEGDAVTGESGKVIGNWAYQDHYKDFAGKWNHYRQSYGTETGNIKRILYRQGDYFKTETVNVEIQRGETLKNAFESPTSNTSSGQYTSANGGKYYNELEVDMLNLDFNQDVGTKFFANWDFGQALPAGMKGVVEYYKIGMGDDSKIENLAERRDWTAAQGDLRTQGLLNFRDAWRNRNLMDDDTSNDLTPDILWVRIESEPWWGTMPWTNNYNAGWTSVRQIIISIDADNTDSTDRAFKFTSTNKKDQVKDYAVVGDFDGYQLDGGLAYKYRPFFIFYKGPETYVENPEMRKSQPVILNLNQNFNGILYAPNSPVVILGNGKKFTGFVVAKEFVQLKTVKDYTNAGYNEYRDLNDRPILVKKGEVFDEEDLDKKYPEKYYAKYPPNTDVNKDVITYNELQQLTKRFIVEAQYVYGMDGYNDDNYVKALKKYREIYDEDREEYRKVTDADIVAIKFPEKDNFGCENNHQLYHVVRADLVDERDLSATELSLQYNKSKFRETEYAKVIVQSTDEVKYIAKKNLPYVRMYINKTNDYYPYIPVCDLKVYATFSNDGNFYGGNNGAGLADDTNDIYKSMKVTEEYQERITNGESYLLVGEVDKKNGWQRVDTWKVVATKHDNKDWWVYSDSKQSTITVKEDEDGTHYTNNRLEKVIDKDGCKYLIFLDEKTAVDKYNQNPTVTATYNRIKDGSSDKYVSSDVGTYYTYYDYQTYEYDKNNQETSGADKGRVIRLVMDNKGNVQTKALDADDYFQITDDYKFQPDDRGWNKKTKNLDTGSKDKDYRIPEYEVVYKKDAFGLSSESRYSYFQIPQLRRINYTYMNVDELNEKPVGKWDVEDMFFTTRRASWID